jgi:eukaryotic-like serine/threonine-protein kinase
MLEAEAFGKYRLVRALAEGGMAQLFLAKQAGPEGFEKTVVVKRVLPHLSVQSDFVRMFLDEARLAARLSHPNIVHVFDFGEVGGAYFLAMEYLPGENLASVMRQARRLGKPIPTYVAALIAGLICDGLSYVHSLTDSDGKPLAIVHRDISPSNLFLTFQGNVTILDFGIAKAHGQLNQTRSGVLKGKLAYTSPEQVQRGPVDARADLFCLGVVLFELLAGRRLFPQKREAALVRALLDEPIPLPSRFRPDVSPELDRIVNRALQRDPGKRFASALAMREEIDGYLTTLKYARPTAQLQGLLIDLFGPEHLRAKTREMGEDEASRVTEGVDLGPSSGAPAEPAEAAPATAVARKRTIAIRRNMPSRRARWTFAAGAAAVVFAAVVLVAVWQRQHPRPLPPLPDEGRLQEPANPAPLLDPPQAPAPNGELPPSDVKPPIRPKKGSLTVNCLPWCHVYLDGADTGLDSPAKGIRLSPGRHRLRVVNPPSKRERSLEVEIRAGQPTFQAVEL